MLSMKDIATMKTVVEICNHPDLKKEILCAPGSYYDRNKGNSVEGNNLRWNEIVEGKASVLVENLGIAKQLQEKITSLVFLVGMRMLIWAEYQECILGLSREYCIKFLNSSFFTPQGIIDSEKAAAELIKDENLNIKQRYKLACLYCFTDHIPVLYEQITAGDKKDFYDAESALSIKQPELVKFWSYYLMNDINRLTNGRNPDQYRLEKAVRSGSKTAVEYCLEKTSPWMKMIACTDAAVEAITCRTQADLNTDKNWVFRNQRSRNSEKSWVPSGYYTDILCFLLSKMGDDEQIEFFKKNIEFDGYGREKVWKIRINVDNFFEGMRIAVEHLEKSKLCFVVLEYFLNWPYQEYFMKKARLMWEFLSVGDYAVLLLMISDKIESKNLFCKYGEGKSFDYRRLLKEFWSESPGRFKRQVFCNQQVTYRTISKVKTGSGLLIKLHTLKNFSYEDGEIIKLILTDTTAKEKEDMFFDEEWISICVRLMEEERWETLDRYTLHCFLSEEEESKFRRELSFSEYAQSVCIDFAKNQNWNAAESFIKWSSLPEEEIKKLKKEIIYSDEGLQSCICQIVADKVKADAFIRWYLPSKEEVKAFKRELIFSDYVTDACISLVENKENKLELMTEFMNFCLLSEGEVGELKKEAAYRYGGTICKYLISDYEIADPYESSDGLFDKRIVFKGGKWEEVEKFLATYFSSKEEISGFKKNKLFEEYGEDIHFQLIESNQWKEAETFFTWLDLSAEEIKELKKNTFYCDQAWEMFTELMSSEEDDERFSHYGSKQNAIELLLRWYLTDMQMVLEFKEKFLKYAEDYDDEILKKLDFIIEQILKDLGDENMEVDSTTETPPQMKDLML